MIYSLERVLLGGGTSKGNVVLLKPLLIIVLKT